MDEQSVCAVVITYHPSAAMVEHTSKVLEQVAGLVIVDNGSSPQELEGLRTASQSRGFHLIENGENLGIAEALNRGVEWARSQGYPWVLLLDQDSNITSGFVQDMFRTWASQPDRGRIGSVQPKYIDPDTGSEARVWRARDGGPVISMTSGSLMPMWIFDRIGLFASEYFIDMVDWEYCLRIRAAGYQVIDSRDAVLLHSAGAPAQRKLLGFAFRPSNHSPMRRYYLSRNRIVLYRKYFFKFPVWTMQAMWDGFRETVKCFVGDRDRRNKLRSLIMGTWDGLMGRMGKRQGI
jgi:rhamnosyltransferase